MPRSPDYSDTEKQIIREHYPTMPREKLEKLLPNRSWFAIRSKAQHLKVKRLNYINAPWSDPDEKYLEENYPDQPSDKIVKRLKRSWPTITAKANDMKIKRVLCDGTGNQNCPGRMYLITNEVMSSGELMKG